jgi:hypothetical protein
MLRPLSTDTRWHYLAMIQWCSRNGDLDGTIRVADARRVSDISDSDEAVSALIAAELVTQLDDHTLQIVNIKDHVPSPDLLARMETDRARAQRYRKHKAGDHSLCTLDKCSEAPSRDASDSSSRDAPGLDGDRTGLAVTGGKVPDVTDDDIEKEAAEYERLRAQREAEDEARRPPTRHWKNLPNDAA